MMEDEEIWAPAFGFEGLYEVSTHGRVVNIAPRKGTFVGKFLKLRTDKKGYSKVVLRNNGVHKSPFIHRLVFESHKRKLLEWEQIDHIDGSPRNNNISNLDAVTHLENMRRSFAKGRNVVCGSRQGRARFTEDDVVSIRNRVKSGEKQNSIAAEFKVTPTAINCIIKRKTWMHLP